MKINLLILSVLLVVIIVKNKEQRASEKLKGTSGSQIKRSLNIKFNQEKFAEDK